MSGGLRRGAVWLALCTLYAGAIGAGALDGYVTALGPAPLGRHLELSATVVDRNGVLLRPYTISDGRWRLAATREEVDPRFLSALIGYEDKRFYTHRGVDPLALLRAAGQIMLHGHIVSGGSTLTMQVARLLEPRKERSFAAKLRQIVRAVEIERHLSKAQILDLYLTLAPYGGNLEGIRAASLAYFRKEPRRLSLGETALLVALPQSPEERRPDRSPKAALAARNRVLDRLAETGIFSASEIARAKAEPVPKRRYPMPLLAPHAADDALAAAPERLLHRLTIDARFQRRLEALAKARADWLGPDVSVAILVLDNATGEVLARVGTPDYFDLRRAGQVDLTEAIRSPGSALKPFIYGLAFEDGTVHPDTLIDDRPVRFGSYAPENFDLQYQGTVTVRQALQMSLNVPAVQVLQAVGPSRLVARLAEVGTTLVLPKDTAPGLALGLGGVGVSLNDLTQAYCGIARLGTVIPAVERETAPRPAPRRLMTPVAAWYLIEILRGSPPPENGLPGGIAFKTGTSYGYRDAWSVGFDGSRTIGVWVGRPDGAPVGGLVGRLAAAPILFDAFARTGKLAPFPAAPKGALIASTAELPPPLQRFNSNAIAGGTDARPRILFPPNGAELALTAEPDGKLDPIPVKIAGGKPPITVLVNGAPLPPERPADTVFFTPDGPGFTKLTVTDASGHADSVLVRLQ
jgi:penicillin-binding protein 1C